jgi:hypothetical protein
MYPFFNFRISKQKYFDVFNPFCTGLANGWPTFVISILMIGLVTALIGDVAGHLGCFIFLKDSVNAIAFVALGTSVPGINSPKNSHPTMVEKF